MAVDRPGGGPVSRSHGIAALGISTLTALALFATPMAAASAKPTAGAANGHFKHSCSAIASGASCNAIVRTDISASIQSLRAAAATPSGYGPADLQSAYKLPSSTAGTGQTIAIVDAYDDPTADADLAV